MVDRSGKVFVLLSGYSDIFDRKQEDMMLFESVYSRCFGSLCGGKLPVQLGMVHLHEYHLHGGYLSIVLQLC